MTNLNSTTCLKVKADTFFLPDLNGGVYFRNNLVSFRMEGEMIDKWIEKLLPMFNGDHSLESLTDGLPEPHRKRVYEIAETLYKNGFIRDVSQDRPHRLSKGILEKYASQIEFLDSFGDSGAFRFQSYRQTKVLAVGSGPFYVSLVAALLESGLAKFHVLVMDSMPTNRHRIKELVAHARKTDPEAALEEITVQNAGGTDWRQAVQQFDVILYVSQGSDLEQLRQLHAICRTEKKVLLPAIFVGQAGLAGPFVHPDSDGCWESAWRRIHRSAVYKDGRQHTFSSTAGAMLANVLVFEWLKAAAGVAEADRNNKVFLVDLETLEGNWHPFLPHPLVTGRAAPAEWVEDLDPRLVQGLEGSESDALLPYFGGLASAETGIFHSWEEGDLKQLPLSQCRVQPVDPLSEGPADLLPEMTRAGLTHDEARRDAGLAGIEAYVSRMTSRLDRIKEGEFVGVGAGSTFAEGISRALQKCLADELAKRQGDRNPFVYQVQPSAVEDKRCRFYLQALTTMQGAPVIGLGEEVQGFPVVWVSTGGCWYGSIDLNRTMAFRRALQQAIVDAQNKMTCLTPDVLEVPSVLLRVQASQNLEIPSCEDAAIPEVLQFALQELKRNGKTLKVLDLALEPFLREAPIKVHGVLLREEDSR